MQNHPEAHARPRGLRQIRSCHPRGPGHPDFAAEVRYRPPQVSPAASTAD